MANGQIKGVGDVGNDRANCYQTVKKGWKSGLRWMVYLLRDSLLWAGRLGCESHLEALGSRLNRKIGTLLGLITGVGWAFLV